MTFQELLNACTDGLPEVESKNFVKTSATSKIGLVRAIKHGDGYYGCAVLFPGIDYNVWFHAEDGIDKRSHYISELTIILK